MSTRYLVARGLMSAGTILAAAAVVGAGKKWG
jgi:hypothetical protein